jgi:hypothetical protein
MLLFGSMAVVVVVVELAVLLFVPGHTHLLALLLMGVAVVLLPLRPCPHLLAPVVVVV